MQAAGNRHRSTSLSVSDQLTWLSMAQLFRAVKQTDSAASHTFSFILPPAVAKEYPPEILSRDFHYGGQKWKLSFVKKDRHLSPYLRLANVNEGTRVWIDYSFVLINQDSFSKNEFFHDKQREFNAVQSSHGHRTFITLDELPNRRFATPKGDYLFEVTLRNVRSFFEEELKVAIRRPDARNPDNLDYQRYDTTRFTFGDLDWSAVFCPNMDFLEKRTARHLIQIKRLTKTDSLCKLRYRIILGVEPRVLKSAVLEEIFDFTGNGEGYYFTGDYYQYAQGNKLLLRLELISFNFTNQLKLSILNELKNKVQLHDKDKQIWYLSSGSFQEEEIHFNLFYADVLNIPANYLRFVSWSLTLVANRSLPGQQSVQLVTACGSPFEQYYSTSDRDTGFRMDTRLTLSEIRDCKSGWLDPDDHKLMVHLDWQDSYLLFHSHYHVYDDTCRRQMLQMRREVQALQSENSQLEKELHNYQLSIASKCGSDQSAVASPTSNGSSYRPRRASAIESLQSIRAPLAAHFDQLFHHPKPAATELQHSSTPVRHYDRPSYEVAAGLPSQPSKDSGIIPDVHSGDSASTFDMVYDHQQKLMSSNNANVRKPSKTDLEVVSNRLPSNQERSRPTTPQGEARDYLPHTINVHSEHRGGRVYSSEPPVEYIEPQRRVRTSLESVESGDNLPLSNGHAHHYHIDESARPAAQFRPSPRHPATDRYTPPPHSVYEANFMPINSGGRRRSSAGHDEYPSRRQPHPSLHHQASPQLPRHRNHQIDAEISPNSSRRGSRESYRREDGQQGYHATSHHARRYSPPLLQPGLQLQHHHSLSPGHPRKNSYHSDERHSSASTRVRKPPSALYPSH